MTKKKIQPKEQAIIDFFYLFDIESCVKSLDDVFELAMADEDYKPTGMDYQIFRFLKQLLQTISPGRRIKRRETSFHSKQSKPG